VEIEALEPSWVAVTDSDGKRLLAKTLDANKTERLDLTLPPKSRVQESRR
jgi:hypothetical protein